MINEVLEGIYDAYFPSEWGFCPEDEHLGSSPMLITTYIITCYYNHNLNFHLIYGLRFYEDTNVKVE
jgi:hypothetical protein